MITKYDPNQYVLLRVKVDGVIVESKDKEPRYNIIVTNLSDWRYSENINFTVDESEIVCGWIGGDGE